ncbi:YbdD/YjiX family protein [Novosphingobium resinovorum]|uniref:YbdD/YjiX family protein n=1 Tax=Novosphingobium resinovorum TaxID=158500 RepID=UPI002ED41A98|nr:YbdD/YjiX family protein [Novosphingobium resinovorum]
MLRNMLRLMVGQPPYEVYLAHMARNHPEAAPMSRVEFFRNREQARFGTGAGKCC